MEFLDNPTVRYIIFGIAIFVLAKWFYRSFFDNQESAELQQQTVSGLISKLDEKTHQDIKNALIDKRKIEAIKIFRGATNTGLLDAKNAIEYLDRKYSAS